ncbi:hypothetical protein EV122DRAFT_254065, partial [Schizophyllum commune]
MTDSSDTLPVLAQSLNLSTKHKLLYLLDLLEKKPDYANAKALPLETFATIPPPPPDAVASHGFRQACIQSGLKLLIDTFGTPNLKGPLPLEELGAYATGPGLSRVVEFLSHLLDIDQGSAEVWGWLKALTASSEFMYNEDTEAELPSPRTLPESKDQISSGTTKRKRADSEIDTASKDVRDAGAAHERAGAPGRGMAKHKKGQNVNVNLADNEEIIDDTEKPRGRQRDPLISRLIYRVKTTGNDKMARWICRAEGCGYTQRGNAASDRILSHAMRCKVLEASDEELYRLVLEACENASLGSALREEAREKGVKLKEARGKGSGTSGSPQTLQQSKLPVNNMREDGKKRVKGAHDRWALQINHTILKLIAVRGLVPHILDSDEWHELMDLLSGGAYHPPASTDFAVWMGTEARLVEKMTRERLKESYDLVLTFDGTSTRKKQSFYTVHATTATRETYFLGALTGDTESHDTHWLQKGLMKTISEVGTDHFSATCSDGAKVCENTRAAISRQIVTIDDLADCGHFLQLTIGDVSKLSQFKPFLSNLNFRKNGPGPEADSGGLKRAQASQTLKSSK